MCRPSGVHTGCRWSGRGSGATWRTWRRRAARCPPARPPARLPDTGSVSARRGCGFATAAVADTAESPNETLPLLLTPGQAVGGDQISSRSATVSSTPLQRSTYRFVSRAILTAGDPRRPGPERRALPRRPSRPSTSRRYHRDSAAFAARQPYPSPPPAHRQRKPVSFTRRRRG